MSSTAVVLPETPWAERVLAFGIDWAKSHGLVSPGQYAVLFRGQIADRSNIRAVLVGVVN